jgi:hypothetical protein
MKVIIAGSRTVGANPVFGAVNAAVDQGWDITEVVSGHCRTGADFWGEVWAGGCVNPPSPRGHLPIKRFPPAWAIHGRAAGPIRNAEMAEYADALILVWDGKSRGSASMKREMEKLGKPIYEVIVK